MRSSVALEASSSKRHRALLALVTLGGALLCAVPRIASAQDITCEPGDTKVRTLEFRGNQTFADLELANGINTTASSFWRRTFKIFGAEHCLDRNALSLDSLRLIIFYRNHGFSDVKVGVQVKDRAPDAVDIMVAIDEGTPLRIGTFAVIGLDSIPERERVLRRLPAKEGERFDKYAIEASRDSLSQRLRNTGYPRVEILRSYEPDTTPGLMRVQFDVVAGARTYIDSIDVRIDPRPGERTRVSTERVKQALGFKPGDLYRERELETAKRSLYVTDAFQHVIVTPDSASFMTREDSTLEVDVIVTENELRTARASAGWGTLDCFRTQVDYSNYDFLNRLQRLDVTARVSKIGTGTPAAFAPSLCAKDIREDVYSDTLNYYVGATLTQATRFTGSWIPSLTVYSERRSEYQAFVRSTLIGGVASILRPSRRYPQTASYQLEYGRVRAEPALFCAVFNVCEATAQERLSELQRQAVLSYTITRNRADNIANPTRGSVVRFEGRHSGREIGSDQSLQFNSGTLDGSWYLPIGSRAVLVGRFRVGAVLGSRASSSGGPAYVPPQERLYAGGPNTVRGFRQNELGPLIYIPQDQNDLVINTIGGQRYLEVDTDSLANGNVAQRIVPSGGDNVIVANLELRFRTSLLPELVQYAIFADAGEVWNRGGGSTTSDFQQLKVTPGVGVRVFTPIGPVRIDVGYNPYPRPTGAAFFDGTRLANSNRQPLYCVSPGNRLPLTGEPPEGGTLPDQASGSCPATYEPPPVNGFLRRLTFNFSIGQAF